MTRIFNFSLGHSDFQAYVVLGQYLVLKKSKDLFIDWLKDDAGANTKQATDCYQCLSGIGPYKPILVFHISR